MSYTIIWDERAQIFLRKLERRYAQRIVKKVIEAAGDPGHYLGGLVDMDARKLRVGDYRVFVVLDEKQKTFGVAFIGHRKDAYKYAQREGLRFTSS